VCGEASLRATTQPLPRRTGQICHTIMHNMISFSSPGRLLGVCALLLLGAPAALGGSWETSPPEAFDCASDDPDLGDSMKVLQGTPRVTLYWTMPADPADGVDFNLVSEESGEGNYVALGLGSACMKGTYTVLGGIFNSTVQTAGEFEIGTSRSFSNWVPATAEQSVATAIAAAGTVLTLSFNMPVTFDLPDTVVGNSVDFMADQLMSYAIGSMDEEGAPGYHGDNKGVFYLNADSCEYSEVVQDGDCPSDLCLSSNPDYERMLELQPGTTLYWTYTPDAVSTMMETNSTEEVWLGVGYGHSCMVGGLSVIAFPEADAQVDQYQVLGRSDFIPVSAEDSPALTDASLAYTEGDGTMATWTISTDGFVSYNATMDSFDPLNLAAANPMDFGVGQAATGYHGGNKGMFILNFLTCETEIIDMETVECSSSVPGDDDEEVPGEEEEEEDGDFAPRGFAASWLVTAGLATALVASFA
jgi:hypothetical protein